MILGVLLTTWNCFDLFSDKIKILIFNGQDSFDVSSQLVFT